MIPPQIVNHILKCRDLHDLDALIKHKTQVQKIIDYFKDKVWHIFEITDAMFEMQITNDAIDYVVSNTPWQKYPEPPEEFSHRIPRYLTPEEVEEAKEILFPKTKK